MNRVMGGVAGGESGAEVTRLFETAAPVLVEIRFPSAGTSPDWYLFTDEEGLEQLMERLAPGVEAHLHSVWHLKNTQTEIVVKNGTKNG